MRIGISGYLGYQNFGDEIFLKTWQQVFKEHEVSAFMVYDDIKSFDRIVIGGGDLIDVNRMTNAYWKPKLLEKPTYVYGVGVIFRSEPEINLEELNHYRCFLSQCKSLSCRDSNSVRFAKHHNLYTNISTVEDVAWSYNIPSFKLNKFNTKKNGIVGVSLRQNSATDWDMIYNFLAKISNEYELMFIPLHPSPIEELGDQKFHEDLKQSVLNVNPDAHINVCSFEHDIDHKIKFIEQCDGYITQRFHGVLMSLRVKTPVLSLNNCPGMVPNKFKTLLYQFGMQHAILGNDFEMLNLRFEEMMDGRLNFKDDVFPKISWLEAKAKTEMGNFKETVLKGI